MSTLDRVKFLAASAGTGAFVPASAVTGFLTPAGAGMANAQPLSYIAFSSDQTQWEYGHSVYTVSGTSIARSPIGSSNSNATVSFTNPPTVAICLLAEDFSTVGYTPIYSSGSGNVLFTTSGGLLGGDSGFTYAGSSGPVVIGGGVTVGTTPGNTIEVLCPFDGTTPGFRLAQANAPTARYWDFIEVVAADTTTAMQIHAFDSSTLVESCFVSAAGKFGVGSYTSFNNAFADTLIVSVPLQSAPIGISLGDSSRRLAIGVSNAASPPSGDVEALVCLTTANGSHAGGELWIASRGSAASAINFYTSSSSALAQVGQFTDKGSFVLNNAAVSTTATDGFLYIPTCAGTPAGTPTSFTGRVPMVYDTTNHKFYIYDGGWKGGTNPGVFS